MKIATAILRLLKANYTGIALLLFAGRSWKRMTSYVMAFLLKAPGLHLGPGCRVIGGRHISFARGIYAERNLWLEAVTSYGSQQFQPNIESSDYVCFSDGVHISSIASILIGNHSLFGSRIYVSDHSHGVYRGKPQSSAEEPLAHRLLGGGGPVVIGENVWIGDNSIILGPATIGRGAIVVANSIVRGVVPPNPIVAGAPAKPIKIFNPRTGSWDKT